MADLTERTHELKVAPNYYDVILTGEKMFEVRRDDRGFQRGDLLFLREHDPQGALYERDSLAYTGREATFRITYILTGGQFGIEPVRTLAELDTLNEDEMVEGYVDGMPIRLAPMSTRFRSAT